MTRGALGNVPLTTTGTRRARWVLTVAAVGGMLFLVGLLVQVRCEVDRCPAPGVRRLFALDGLGSLPRDFTTAVFVAVAVMAGTVCWGALPRVRYWWGAVAVSAAALAVSKAVSVHSSLERDDGRLVALVGGVVLSAVELAALLEAGRRWSVRGTVSVVAALAAYAVAALGLDQVTAAAVAVSSSPVLLAFAVYVEEGGEAATAVFLLATVVQVAPRRAAVGTAAAQS